MPDSLELLEYYAFSGCAALERVRIGADTQVQVTEAGDYSPFHDPEATMPEKLRLLGEPGSAVQALAKKLGLSFEEG